MEYSYKGKNREGVIFLFKKGEKIVIEKRKAKDEKIDIFFPNGSIEEKDKLTGYDYRETALKREVNEEFNSQVELSAYKLIHEIIVDGIQVHFYLYLITKWNGEIPEFTIEDGIKHADLEWVNILDYEKIFEFDSAKEICRFVIANYL